MYILGVAGWICSGHDASAALLKNGQLAAAAEEERFIRRKHCYDALPHNAIRFCLNEAKIEVDDIDYVAFYWNLPYHYELRNIQMKIDQNVLIKALFPSNMFQYTKTPEVKLIDHHLSHAASAFRASGFDESAIMVVDGSGEDSSTSLWRGVGNEILLVRKFDIPSSIGFFYEGATGYVGFEPNEPGKTMGLAPFGKPKAVDFFAFDRDGYRAKLPEGPFELKSLTNDEEQLRNYWMNEFSEEFGPKNEPKFLYNKLLGGFKLGTAVTNQYMDAAATSQKTLEELMLHLTEVVTKETGYRNLCVAGGVGLNCVANGKILHSSLVDNVFVQPAANDAGCSLGAALELNAQLGNRSKFKMEDAYWGSSFSDDEIEGELCRLKIGFEHHKNIESFASEILAEGRILGWFQGKMEWGPRALGNRSILADPRDPGMKDKLNSSVKFREWFRPFSPSIMESMVNGYLIEPRQSPFMLFNFNVQEERKPEVPAVVHVDGTTRAQTVTRQTNPRYFELLHEFNKRTGTPLILNTSFNIKGEPIVCTPYDAIRTFYSSGLDYLVIGSYAVNKASQPLNDFFKRV